MAKINRENIYHHLLEKQLNLIEKCTYDAVFTKDWAEKWSITQEQADSFRKYALALIRRVFKVNKTKSEQIFALFIFNHGLEIKN